MPRITPDERSPYLEDQLWEEAQPAAMSACADEMRAYLDVATRQKALRRLPYREYLLSEHWKATRNAARHRAGYRCQRCGKQYEPAERGKLNVHHLSYDRLGAERDEDLEVLCRPCHASGHGH